MRPVRSMYERIARNVLNKASMTTLAVITAVLEVRIGWHEDGAVYLIELSDDSAVKEGLLDNLYMQFLNELEAMGSPFHVSFGHLNNKYLRLENPTKTFPALAQAA